MPDDPSAMSPVPAYIIRLLYKDKPVVDKAALLAELQSIDPVVRPLGDGIAMFVNETHKSKDIAGGPGSPVLVSPAEKTDRQELELALPKRGIGRTPVP